MIEAANMDVRSGSSTLAACGVVNDEPDGTTFGETLAGRMNGANRREPGAAGVPLDAKKAGGHGQAQGLGASEKHAGAHKIVKPGDSVEDAAKIHSPASGTAGQLAPVTLPASQARTLASFGVQATDDASETGAGSILTAQQKLKSGASAMPGGETTDAATAPAADASGTLEITRLATAWVSQIALPAGPKAGEAQESAFAGLQAVQPVALTGGSVPLHTNAREGAVDATVATASVEVEHGLQADQAMVFEASTHALEVGVANATHGWLRVRAEVDDAGAVVAQVVATNAAAADGLHRELPALSAYLAGEHVLVSSLAVHAMHAAGNTQQNSTGEGGGFSFVNEDGTSGRPGEDEARGARAAAQQERTMDAAIPDGPALSHGRVFQRGLGGLNPGLNGGWLSIRV